MKQLKQIDWLLIVCAAISIVLAFLGLYISVFMVPVLCIAITTFRLYQKRPYNNIGKKKLFLLFFCNIFFFSLIVSLLCVNASFIYILLNITAYIPLLSIPLAWRIILTNFGCVLFTMCISLWMSYVAASECVSKNKYKTGKISANKRK